MTISENKSRDKVSLSVRAALKETLDEVKENESIDVFKSRFLEKVSKEEVVIARLIEYSLSERILFILRCFMSGNNFLDNSNKLKEIFHILFSQRKIDERAIVDYIMPIYLDATGLDYGINLKHSYRDPKKLMSIDEEIYDEDEQTNNKEKKSSNTESINEINRKERERNYHVRPLSWLFYSSYTIVFLSWVASFIYLFINDSPWWRSVLPCAMSLSLTIVSIHIIPLIQSSYEKSMRFNRVTYFLEIRNKETDAVKNEVIKMI